MPKITKISISIEENAHAFLNEAVEKALQATEDIRHWQFAILHLVQALELSLKSLLQDINPVLIYENIENPKNTISAMKAIERLQQPLIKGLDFGSSDKLNMRKAIELRNKITHANFELTEQFAEKKFFELFAFVVHFQARFLQVEIEDIISEDNRLELIELDKSRQALLKKALNRIEEEAIPQKFILDCPSCSEGTFIAKDGINRCYLCTHTDSTTNCPHCDNLCFDWEMDSFESELDYGYEEGIDITHNDYGYSNFQACPDCLKEIISGIIKQRDEEYYKIQQEHEMTQEE